MIKLTRVDATILITLLILLVIVYSLTWVAAGSSRYVSLYVGEERRYIIDLMEEKTLMIEGFKGVSQLQISNGKVRFIQSPCATHACIRSSWLNETIGLIACLPNGVSLYFLNHNKTYDAINF